MGAGVPPAAGGPCTKPCLRRAGEPTARRPHHRAGIAGAQRGCGRGSDQPRWDVCPSRARLQDVGREQGVGINGAPRLAPYPTVVTAGMAHRARLEGIEVLGAADRGRQDAEWADVQETGRASAAQREEARERVLARLHHRVPCLGSKKRTALALDMVQQLAQAGHFSSAPLSR